MGSEDAYEQSASLLESQAHIRNHIFSFISSMTLKCAVELQIPDIISRHGGPMLLSELVEALAINEQKAQFIYRLMRILVHSGFFVKQSVSATGANDETEREGYRLTPASRLLLKDEPLSMRPYLLAMLHPVLMDPWQQMRAWFQDDDMINPFQKVHGKMIFELASQEPMFNQLLNDAMATDARLAAVVILQHLSIFQGLDSIVDVGGGNGTLAKAVAAALPELTCICFDLLHVVKGLDGSKNMRYVGGNMFEAIPNADAVLLKRILHDWSDEECLKILKRCKEGIPTKENGGKVIIIDMVVMKEEDGNKTLETQLRADMMMMILATGKERTEEEWAKLFSDAGFSEYKITPLLGFRSLIEVYYH